MRCARPPPPRDLSLAADSSPRRDVSEGTGVGALEYACERAPAAAPRSRAHRPPLTLACASAVFGALCPQARVHPHAPFPARTRPSSLHHIHSAQHRTHICICIYIRVDLHLDPRTTFIASSPRLSSDAVDRPSSLAYTSLAYVLFDRTRTPAGPSRSRLAHARAGGHRVKEVGAEG